MSIAGLPVLAHMDLISKSFFKSMFCYFLEILSVSFYVKIIRSLFECVLDLGFKEVLPRVKVGQQTKVCFPT